VDAEKNYWSGQDGAITLDSRGRRKHGYDWLLTEQEFADFDLKMKVRSFRESSGNSGAQVRSRSRASNPSEHRRWVAVG
jgi:hypothetical protein